jgi:hypothetical protein
LEAGGEIPPIAWDGKYREGVLAFSDFACPLRKTISFSEYGGFKNFIDSNESKD